MTATLRGISRPVGAFVLALAIAALVILATGGQPLPAFAAMARGAFGDPSQVYSDIFVRHHLEVPKAILMTLAKATPLLFSGLAVALALRAGMFNIGAEGQIVMGGLAAAWAGFAITGLPTIVHLPLAIGIGMAAGALWGMVPGLLKAWRGTHEVIVTIMMNYIAFELARYLVNHTVRDKTTLMTATPMVLPTARLWQMPGTSNFSAGFYLALLAAIGVAFMIRRTSLGYEIRAVGLAADAARTAGIRVGRVQVTAMTLSGALAGLAGAVEVLGVHRRYLDAFSPGYGFDSIAVALLGGLNSLGVTLSSLLFGALNSGKLMMERETGIPSQIALVVQAVVIIAVGARYLRRKSE